MILVTRSFHALSRRFVGFNEACVFCLASTRGATGLLVLSSSGLAKHCCWHRNFQLSPRFSNSFLEFIIRWINEVNTAQCPCLVKLRFFDGPLLLLFSFWRFRHVFPYLWPQGVWPGCRLLPCQSLPMYIHPVVFHQIFLANLHASPQAHRSCLSVSSKHLSSNFTA